MSCGRCCVSIEGEASGIWVSGNFGRRRRSDALEALNRQDPKRASIALGRTAIDQSATWDLRIETIQRLGWTVRAYVANIEGGWRPAGLEPLIDAVDLCGERLRERNER